MIVPLQRVDVTSANTLPETAANVVDSTEHDSTEERDDSGRRLRNRIILANIIAWIVIAVGIRLIF